MPYSDIFCYDCTCINQGNSVWVRYQTWDVLYTLGSFLYSKINDDMFQLLHV